MKIWFLIGFLLLEGGAHAAKDNIGKEFMLCFMDNLESSDKYDLEVFITTKSNIDAKVNVTIPLFDATWSRQVTVRRGTIEALLIPDAIRGKDTKIDGLGVHIISLEDITVYAVNKIVYSTDGFVALPVDAVGKDYIAVTYRMSPEIMVVAITDETVVTFQFSSDYNGEFTYQGSTYSSGDTLTVTLNRYQTFHIYSQSGDMSGTRITATSPISAFSGNLRVKVVDTMTLTSKDHLVEQLVPTQSWGKRFITFPSPDRVIGDYVRVFAAEDDTVYTIGGEDYTLHANAFNEHKTSSNEYNWLNSTKGIQVVVFSKTEGIAETNDAPNGGDPSLSNCPPVDLYQSDYTWSTVTTASGNFTNYVIVVSLKAYVDDLVLDHKSINATWVDVNGKSDYAGTIVRINPGSHSIYNRVPAHPFMAIAYGNALHVSYSYPVGTRLDDINLPCTPSAIVAGDGKDNDCDGIIDEETDNGIDDDGDGSVDEDLAMPPRVDGQWGAWAAWGSCSSVCPGTKERTLNCDNPAPANYGLDCFGSGTESVSCTTSKPCPIDGQWGAWAAWGSCSSVCYTDPGTKERTRNCDNPAPANNGLDCVGSGTESVSCTTSNPCPIDGQWGAWAAWGSCSSVCYTDPGTKERTRNCDNPAPANNGLDCVGSGTESVSCTTSNPCPIDGQWGVWAAWGSCSTECGTSPGTRERNRNCDNPAPANDGLDCVGSGKESGACVRPTCPPVHGEWSNWGVWSTCSVTCGLGTQNRIRLCDNPPAKHGGNDCAGSYIEKSNCTIKSYCLPSFYGNLDLGCNNATQFGCATGGIKCIDITFRCDSLLDCDDASDESEAFTGCAHFSKSSSGHVYGSLLHIGLCIAIMYIFKIVSFGLQNLLNML